MAKAKAKAKPKPAKSKAHPAKSKAKSKPAKSKPAKSKATRTATAKAASVRSKKAPASPGRFEQAGELMWAVLAPLDVSTFEAHVLRLAPKHRVLTVPELDEPRSWTVLPGTGAYSALIETQPGNASAESELARPLSKALGITLYALGFSGYNDPDHGLPYIERYDRGKSGLIWMEPSYEDDEVEPKTVPGPKDVPCKDPFDFAEALGCALRDYYD